MQFLEDSMKAMVVLLFFFWFTAVPTGGRAETPNFLVIVADDLGFSDLGSYGGDIDTPNLDALAADGLRFTQFYNTGRCWPTRASLLTGYYAQQVRRGEIPGFRTGKFVRPVWARLIPERLRAAGYRSYHSGKWHVDGQPTDNGFDLSNIVKNPGYNYGYFHLQKRIARHGVVERRAYLTTATADHAISSLKEHAANFRRQPFFQYLAFHAPHFPLQALPEDIGKYSNRYLPGWDVDGYAKAPKSGEHKIWGLTSWNGVVSQTGPVMAGSPLPAM